MCKIVFLNRTITQFIYGSEMLQMWFELHAFGQLHALLIQWQSVYPANKNVVRSELEASDDRFILSVRGEAAERTGSQYQP